MSLFLFAQNNTCSTAEPFCTAVGVDFSNTTGAGNAETGPDYGCLLNTPNPSWFFLKIDNPGDLFMLIEQNAAADFTGAGSDVDFIAWGPFTETEFLAGVCGDLTQANSVPGDGTFGVPNTTTSQGCSFSINAVENFNIIGANTGEYFVLLITNFDDTAGFIRIRLTNPGGGGTTDSSILNSTLGLDIDACITNPATPVVLDGTTTGATSYKWFFDDGTGFSQIIGQTNPTIDVFVSGTYQIEASDGTDIVTDEIVVTFFDPPIGTSATETTCNNVSLNHDLTNDVSLVSTFSWLAVDNPNVTGESLTANTTSNITDTLTNISGVAQTVAYTVTPTDSTNSCVGDDFTVTVTVNPEPVVIFLLDYPKFLTPNNDGYNDYWQLIGLDATTFTISPIQIFDRFGKIIAIINPTQGQGWDGLYNNEMLPSSDYWFVLSLTNNQGETIIKKGHFSLVRR